MTKLHISSKLSLPADAVTSTIVVYGGKGMGKTNLASVLVEEFASADLRFAVIDPMGVWWGLRHGADGKGPGIKVLVLGGIHGDLPITATSGALVADLVIDEDASVIIDISRRPDGSMWAISERIRFVRDYAKRLYQRQGEKRRPVHQVIDEAARFAPQIVRQGEMEVAACMGAIAVLVEEGRNVGIGVTLVTQRSARLNKDVAELADCMIAFRIVGPNSMRAVLDWLGEHVEKSRLKDISEKVRSLPRGSALVVSPGWLEFEGIVAMRMRETFDSSATPKAGKEVRASGAGAKVDLAKYRERFAELIEEQKANDPKTLKARVADLERQILKGTPATKINGKTEIKIVEHAVVKDVQIKRVEVLIDRGEQLRDKVAVVLADFGMATNSLKAALALASKPMPAPIQSSGNRPVRTGVTSDAKSAPRVPDGRPALTHQDSPKAITAADGGEFKLDGPARRVLNALAWFEAIGISAPSATALAFMSNYSGENGAFNNQRGRLRTAGLVDYPSPGTVQLTSTGRSYATSPDILPTGEGLRAAVMRVLDGPGQRVLQPLIDAYPGQITAADLAPLAGYSDENGAFNNQRGRLRTLGLVTYPARGAVRAADLLFPEAVS